jgi:hypothetical protein
MVPWNGHGLILALAYPLTLLPAILCDAQLVSNFRNVIIAVAAVLDSAFLIQAVYKVCDPRRGIASYYVNCMWGCLLNSASHRHWGNN